MSEHLPRHRLEEWVAMRGASGSAAEAREREHLSACAQCEARLHAIEQASAAFLAQRPPPELARAVMSRASGEQPRVRSRRPSWNKFALFVGFAATAAAAVLWLQVRPGARPEAIRFKGGASLAVYAKYDGHITLLHDGDALVAGTQLAFECSLARPLHLLLLSIDDTGEISRYFPPQDAAPSAPHEPLKSGTRVQLPIGIELDRHRGAERLFAFFSDAALDETSVRSALSTSYADARARGLTLSQLARIHAPDMQAEQVSLWYRKP